MSYIEVNVPRSQAPADTVLSWRIRGVAAVLAIGFAVFLQGCAQPERSAIKVSSQTNTAQVAPANASNGGVLVPAAGPGTGSGLANYGASLSNVDYRTLVLGNTLFRPLADGGRTMIYLTSRGVMRIRLISPQGAIINKSGEQSVRSNGVCWTLPSATQPLCFTPYWNGRLLTLASKNHEVLPAQFLVQRGNPEHL